MKLTLSSHLSMSLSDSSMLTDKSGPGVLFYLHLARIDCGRSYVWTGKARRRSRLFCCCRWWIRGLLCAGWMSVFTVCLHCLYQPRLADSVHRDSQVHCRVQEMTMIMPNVPFASVSFVVMDMVCNRVGTWPRCLSALKLPPVAVPRLSCGKSRNVTYISVQSISSRLLDVNISIQSFLTWAWRSD